MHYDVCHESYRPPLSLFEQTMIFNDELCYMQIMATHRSLGVSLSQHGLDREQQQSV